MAGQQPVIIDTSTLINYLVVNRVDLLADNHRYRFVVTEHVRGEVTGVYAEQSACLESAIESGQFEEIPVVALDELVVFARLSATGQLGPGECASIAAAVTRGCVLAIDDKLAAKKARGESRALVILDTKQLMVQAIQDGRISVAEADEIKTLWAEQFRFLLKFDSFAELL